MIYFGNLIKLKRVDSVIECCSRLFSSFNFQLLIAGSGPEEANLKALVSNTIDPENVIFLGQVPYSNMASYIACADVLMLLSESEGLPGCIQEAFACGVPVIATNVGGIRDIVIDDLNGFLINEPHEAEGKLSSIICNPDLNLRLGREALSFAQNNLSVEVIVQRLDDLYRTEIGNAR